VFVECISGNISSMLQYSIFVQIILRDPIKEAIVCLGVPHSISMPFVCYLRKYHLRVSDVQSLCTRIHTSFYSYCTCFDRATPPSRQSLTCAGICVAKKLKFFSANYLYVHSPKFFLPSLQ